jgi:hypothetical protein
MWPWLLCLPAAAAAALRGQTNGKHDLPLRLRLLPPPPHTHTHSSGRCSAIRRSTSSPTGQQPTGMTWWRSLWGTSPAW